jgi:hypothetical protein
MALAAAVGAQPDDERTNRFSDPFFQISAVLADCAEPVGPRITAQEQRVQSHHRAERGTTCWLSGLCDRPNAYAYDPGIADEIRRTWPAESPLTRSTLWVTVQARTVYFEGCVPQAEIAEQLERYARSIPQVLQAIALVSTPAAPRPPYPVWREPTARNGPPLR